jgi:hypothetical protein
MNNNPFSAFIKNLFNLCLFNVGPISLLAIVVLFEDFIEFAQQTRVGLVSKN